MNWNELAAKNRVESRFTGNQRFFSPAELALAMRITAEAAKRAKHAPVQTSPGESTDQTLDSNRVGVR